MTRMLRVGMFSPWQVRCGIADYTAGLIAGLRTLEDVDVSLVPFDRAAHPRADYVRWGHQLNGADVAHVQHEYSVFGYRTPLGDESRCDFFLFDWKATDQDASREGFTLTRVKGNLPIVDRTESPWWNHQSSPTFQVLATDHGKAIGDDPERQVPPHELRSVHRSAHFLAGRNGRAGRPGERPAPSQSRPASWLSRGPLRRRPSARRLAGSGWSR